MTLLDLTLLLLAAVNSTEGIRYFTADKEAAAVVSRVSFASSIWQLVSRARVRVCGGGNFDKITFCG